MAVAIEKAKITREEGVEIAKECYVVEDLDFIAKKFEKPPNIIKMYRATETHFVLPFHIAWKFGFKTEGFPWVPIHSIKETEDNIYDIDENDEGYRPFNATFRDYQEAEIDKIFADLNRYGSTTLGFPPGWGKTMFGLFCIWRLGLRGIVLMSMIPVLNGWIESAKEFMPNFKVWVVDSRTECPEDVDIILCMDERFKYIPRHILPTIGTFIADEFHMLCTEPRVNIFLSLFPKYVILETATLEQAKYFKMAHKLAGEHGHFKISDKPYNVYLIKTGIRVKEVKQKIGRDEYLSISKMRQSLQENEFRQSILLNVLMLNCEYHRIICLRMVTKSINEFVEKIRACGITCDSLYGNKKKCINSQVTVGTSQKMGVGYDEKMALIDFWKNPVTSDFGIFENTTPNKYIYEQNRGRWMRSENPAVAFLIDENPKCMDHIRRLKPWIKETNGTIIEVNYWDFVLPGKTQIFTRKCLSQTFYRIVTAAEYTAFSKYHIVDGNEDDYGEVMLKLYRTDDDVSEKISEMYENNPKMRFVYVLELTGLNVLSSETEPPEYITTCPICRFHVQNIHKVEL